MTIQGDSWRSVSVETTRAFGEALGRAMIGGLTIGLTGPLGAGKTQLVKGIAVGNGIDDDREVTSPTFTLVHEYPGTLTLYHLDAYRLTRPSELVALGFDEMIQADAAVVVEWADRVRAVMPEDTLWVELAITGETTRDVVLRATGPRSGDYLKNLRAANR